MSIVCLDTQILYWAIVKRAVQGSEKLVPMAVDFLKWLEKQDHTIILPTIVVGEMLIPVSPEQRPNVLAQFRKDWVIVEYDLKAATTFASMRYDHIMKKRLQDMRTMHPDLTKKELVADLMIIATAISHGADTMYSHNKDLRELAEGYIVAKDFMDENFQISMNLNENVDDQEP